MLLDVLFKALTENVSIEVDGNTVRETLNEQLGVCHLKKQEHEMNAALSDYYFSVGTLAELVMKATLVKGKNGKLRRKWLAIVVVLLDGAPKKVYKRYRRRFGIECSYRMMRQVRVMAISKNPALRFFLLKRFVYFLCRYIEQKYGVVMAISARLSPEIVIY